MKLIRTALRKAAFTKYVITEKLNDWRYGIYTATFLWPSDVKNDNPEFHPYGAISYRQFREIFEQIEIESDKDVLLDLGSGMGRAVLLAALRPFRNVIGVEISRILTDIAKRNASKMQRRLVCKSVELHNIDARDYEVPGDVTMVLLFSPFSGTVLKSVCDRIMESVRKFPREIRIIYAYPTGANCLEEISKEVNYIKNHRKMRMRSNGLAVTFCSIKPEDIGLSIPLAA
jgi:predicted RNA methylase